jgi:hypothetical protein
LTVAYFALATGIVVWLILVRKLSAKSWEAGLASDGELTAHESSLAGEARRPVALPRGQSLRCSACSSRRTTCA